MSKKGVIIASAVATAITLAGCAPQHEPPPRHKAASSRWQSGYSSKLGKTGRHGCNGRKSSRRGGNKCKGNSCT